MFHSSFMFFSSIQLRDFIVCAIGFTSRTFWILSKVNLATDEYKESLIFTNGDRLDKWE